MILAVLCAAAMPEAAWQPATPPPATPQPAAPEDGRKAILDLFPLDVLLTVDLGQPAAAAFTSDATRAYVPMRGEKGGKVVAVSLSDGTVHWNVDVATVWPPAVGNGLVFVASDTGIRALDAATGATRWQMPTQVPLAAPLLWDTGWLIVAQANGDLHALHADSGERVWQRRVGTPLHAIPAIAADGVYASLTDGRIVAFDLLSGASLWERQVGEPANEILALDDRLFVGSLDNFFYCLSRESGRVRWQWRAGGDVIGAPIVDRSRVYFLSLDNELRALDRNHGALRWRRPLPTRPRGSPLRVGDVLIVSGLSADLFAYHTDDGAAAGQLDLSAAAGSGSDTAVTLAGPPRRLEPLPSVGERLLIVTGDGRLHVVSRSIEPPLVPLNFLPGAPRALPPPP